MKNQADTPFLTALDEYTKENVTSFDVPGHHLGNINNDFKRIVGNKVLKYDSNAPRGLDNLSNPKGVLKESLELLAEAYDADYGFFLVNGTSVGIIAMIMSSVKAKEKIILPRNIHKSVISGLILSGAIPVFIEPMLDDYLMISNNTSYEKYEEAILKNSDAKCVFILNPTYFGVATDILQITELAHSKKMLVIADEAHGAHFHFSKKFPMSASSALVDISSASFHKTGCSLTQSSILLVHNQRISHKRILKTINLLQTTSPSQLLMASLDASRKTFALEGKEKLDKAIRLSRYTVKEINKIPGLEVISKDYFLKRNHFDFDETKLIIKFNEMNLTGQEAYNILKDEYHIQMELAEVDLILAIITMGTKKQHIDLLIHALQELSKRFYDKNVILDKAHFSHKFPEYMIRPREAYHAPSIKIRLEDAEGEISSSTIMVYPPGIPLIIPGEKFTQDTLKMIFFYREKGYNIMNDYSDLHVNVIDQEKWEKGEDQDD